MDTKEGTVEPAVEGEEFPAKIMHGGETMVHVYTVGPKCDTNNGLWHCMTHDQIFQNNWQKDSHIHEGDHRLTWVCIHHGPEVP